MNNQPEFNCWGHILGSWGSATWTGHSLEPLMKHGVYMEPQMTEQEWLTSNDPAAMLEFIRTPYEQEFEEHRVGASDRKLRLFVEACREQYNKDYPKQRSGLGWPLDLNEPDHLEEGLKVWTGMELINRKRTCNLLRDLFGNPFRPVEFVLRCQRTGNRAGTDTWHADHICPCTGCNAFMVALTIHDERRWEDMPILADCLEEAGCTNERILEHCHGLELISDAEMPNKFRWAKLRGPHVRGCWVVDRFLGME